MTEEQQHEIRNAVTKLQLAIRYLGKIKDKYPSENKICEDMIEIMQVNLRRILKVI